MGPSELDCLRLSSTTFSPALLEKAVRARPARVLFINDTARNGGPGRSLYCILKFLDPERIHRAVLVPRPGVISDLLIEGRVVDELWFEPNLIENPVEPWGRAMRREDFQASIPLQAARLVANVLKGGVAMARLRALVGHPSDPNGFDLIYCNGTTADFAGAALAAMTGVPALWHVRYTSVPKAIRPLHQRLARSSFVRRIVCVSHAAAGLFPHCADKVRVVHNALDTDEFSVERVQPCLRLELGLPAETVVLGSHGRILPRKGYVEMIRAAHRAISWMAPEERERCRFAILGDTPEDIRPDHLAECRELVAYLGVGEYVFLLGFRKDVRAYVADFDVAVVPSVYADPLPRSVMECMALGKPVIAFDVGGVREMVQNGVTGCLLSANPPDIEGLARAFLTYFRDASLRQRQGERARAAVETEFNGKAHGARIQSEILDAIASTH